MKLAVSLATFGLILAAPIAASAVSSNAPAEDGCKTVARVSEYQERPIYRKAGGQGGEGKLGLPLGSKFYHFRYATVLCTVDGTDTYRIKKMVLDSSEVYRYDWKAAQ